MSAIAEREDRTSTPETKPPRVEVISRDPEYLSGWPRFPGTRVPVRNLIDCLLAGETIDGFLEGYPGVTREQAENVLRYFCQREKLYRGSARYWGLDEGRGSDHLDDDPETW